MKKKIVKGGNTNIYKTKIKPRKLKRYTNRGGGLFKFLSNGLKHVIQKAPSSLATITKKAVSEGTSLAKKQLQKKSVQKAIKHAVKEASKMAVNHAIQKVSSSTKIPPNDIHKLIGLPSRSKSQSRLNPRYKYKTLQGM